MILNHKSAFEFIAEHRSLFAVAPTLAAVEEVHRKLTASLGVGTGIRNRLIGITGSAYQPIDNAFQLREAIEELLVAVRGQRDPYSKALLLLAGISWIQAFEDGNKRTARLVANAALMGNGLAPLSYRNVNEASYREAALAFYEQRTIVPLKSIFLEQYAFSATHYGIQLP